MKQQSTFKKIAKDAKVRMKSGFWQKSIEEVNNGKEYARSNGINESTVVTYYREKFKNELLPYLKRVHGSVTHIGKKPEKDALIVSKTDKLTEMRKKLSELVKNENYEEAAVMRDKIKLYEEERNNE
jgi:excinuclease UvrABC helicase subunit UvrB